MMSGQSSEWGRPAALLPAIAVVSPFFLNKFVYIAFPGYPIFITTDYACRIFSLVLLYLLLRDESTSLPVPWRLAVPSIQEVLIALIGLLILIGVCVVGQTFLQYLSANSWQVTSYPSPTSSALQYFDGTVGMVFVGLSEEVVFRFYLINLLLLRSMSSTKAVVGSTLIFAATHWSYGAGAMAFAAIAGLVLSITYLSVRNLIAPIIAHAALDAFFFAGGIAFLWRIYNNAWQPLALASAQ